MNCFERYINPQVYRIASNCGPLPNCSSKLIFYSFKATQFQQLDTEHVVLQCYLIFSCSIFPICKFIFNILIFLIMALAQKIVLGPPGPQLETIRVCFSFLPHLEEFTSYTLNVMDKMCISSILINDRHRINRCKY